MSVKVKICCINSIEEAKKAIKIGADAVGLVGNMPSGPGVISDNQIQKIARNVSPPISTFLLTSETTAEGIIEHYKKTLTSTIQIVDSIDRSVYKSIKTELPWVKLVQVIHVIDDGSIAEAKKLSNYVDAILLDSGNPKLAVKELGGTGRTHNWEISAKIRSALDKPVFLAGGINKDNVIQAIEKVEPYGIDLCSGVRTNGKLDDKKLKDFFGVLSQFTKS